MKLEPVWRVVRLEVPVAAKGCFLYTRLCLSVTPVAVVGCVCTESGLSGYLDFHLNFREHHSFKCNTVAGTDLSNPLLPRCTVEFSRMPCVIQRATRKQLVIQWAISQLLNELPSNCLKSIWVIVFKKYVQILLFQMWIFSGFFSRPWHKILYLQLVDKTSTLSFRDQL